MRQAWLKCGVAAAWAMTLVLSGSASAQTTLESPLSIRAGTSDTVDTVTFGASDCSSSKDFRWVVTTLPGQPCSSLKLWATDAASCGDAPGAKDLTFNEQSYVTVLTVKTLAFTVKISELPGFAASDTTTPCGAAGIEKTHRLCASIGVSTFNCTSITQLHGSPEFKLVYDTKAPSAPVISEIEATNSTASVHFEADADTETIRPEVKGPDDADFVSRSEVSGTTGNVSIKGLKNGDTYEVRLRAVDAAGNVSDASEAVSATPKRTVGFWGAFRDAGGAEQGGCSATAGLLPLAAALWLVSRRRVR